MSRLRNQDGFTLMEVLMAVTVGFVVLAATPLLPWRHPKALTANPATPSAYASSNGPSRSNHR